MDYNTQRRKLALPEYGRNIQKMIAWTQSLPNKEDRNKQIRAVVAVMGNLNPHLRDISDFRHKLWDHIQIISNFQIDIDSPYPVLQESTMYSKPQRVPYPTNPVKIPHYGRCIQDMIDKIVKLEESEKKQNTIMAVANQMKKSYIIWNKDSVKDEQIIKDLYKLSNGAIVLDENTKLFSGKPPVPAFLKNGTSQQSHKGKQKTNGKQQIKKKFKTNK